MRKIATLGLATSVTLLAACGNTAGSTADGPVVVAGLYPFAYVAEQVAGNHAAVTNLTDAGAESHDLELSPQQVAELTDADVIVYEAGFQPAVDDAVEENAEGATVEVTEVTQLEHTGAAHDHGDDHGDDDHAAESETELDPHIWQDPTKLVPVAEAVADRLSDADPEHAADYRANAQDLVDELSRLDREIRATLADCERRAFVTSHAAFGYLAARYDLAMVPIAGVTPDSEPSPARLAQLRDVVEQEGVTTIFTEPLTAAGVAQTLADETGADVAVLDPIEGLTDQTEDEDYLSLMRSNADALAQANGCT